MIQVKKDFEKPIKALNKKRCREVAEQALDQKSKHNFDKYRYYGDEEVRSSLNEIYHGKCAYCESKIDPVAAIQIDHYRPKKRVKEASQHQGYYWLGYEWSNLLPACPRCNGQNAKGNQFPILGIRVDSPNFDAKGKWDRSKCDPRKSPLKEEKPLLLNPELDQPESHFSFEKNTGKMIGKTEKGINTINICDLSRDGLCTARKKKIDQFFDEIRELINGFEKIKQLTRDIVKAFLYPKFDRLKSLGEPDESYSLLGKFMYQEFDLFVKEQIESYFQKILCRVFQEYKLENRSSVK